MSIHHVIHLACDRCPTVSSGEHGEKAREVRALAKFQSWKLGKKQDLCPKCKAGLAEAIKETIEAYPKRP